MLQVCYVSSQPIPEAASPYSELVPGARSPTNEHTDTHNDEKVISVRITSSVAVARGNSKPTRTDNEHNLLLKSVKNELAVKNMTETMENDEEPELPPNLRGANREFLKQLHAKKEPNQFSPEQDFETSALRYDDEQTMSESNTDQTSINTGDAITSKILSSDNFKDFRSKSLSILDDALKLADERINPNVTEEVAETKSSTENVYLSTFYEGEYSVEDKSGVNLSDSTESKEMDDSLAESSIKSILEITKQGEDLENVPLARSLPRHAQGLKNYIQDSRQKPPSERESSTRLTTISFNIVHDAPKAPSYSEQKPYQNPTHYQDHKFYETPTIYSEPAKIYSEPAKVYSEPAKVYSEPAKVYSEPAKVYSEPAKVYSEPAKFYSQPASLHLHPRNYPPPVPVQWQLPSTARITSTEPMQTAEENYEIDEKVSVLSDGRSHGVQESTTEKCKQENCKVGYVVKGRQFNKYRVEERTSDGFIVGEYGVVRNEDGALRGVRYTADSEASPRLIYDALMKFLQLK